MTPKPSIMQQIENHLKDHSIQHTVDEDGDVFLVMPGEACDYDICFAAEDESIITPKNGTVSQETFDHIYHLQKGMKSCTFTPHGGEP